MRGRKPVPTHLKLIKGNPGKRALGSEPQPQRLEQVPEPPAFLLLGQRFLGSNHIRQPRRVCKTRCGRPGGD